jgi:hypothetical protein
MIAVFFASLSLTMLSNAELEGASTLETASICIMSLVLVLNVFTVLTMSMIYYCTSQSIRSICSGLADEPGEIATSDPLAVHD